MHRVVIVIEGQSVTMPLKGYKHKSSDTYEDLLAFLPAVVQRRIAEHGIETMVTATGKTVSLSDTVTKAGSAPLARIICQRKRSDILDRLYGHFRRHPEDIHYISVGSIVNYHMEGPSFNRQQYPTELIEAARRAGKMLHIYIIDPGAADADLSQYQVYNRLKCAIESTAPDDIKIYACAEHAGIRIHTVPHMINITEEMAGSSFNEVSTAIKEANGGLLISWAGVALMHKVVPYNLEFNPQWIASEA